jgi:hypothetical protein
MRKHASFAVAALVFTFALILFAAFNVDGTTADTLRERAGTPHVAPVGSFLSVKNIEAVW